MNFKGIPSLQNYVTIKESEAFTKNQIPYKMNRVYRVLKRNVRNVRFLRHIPVSQGWPPQDQLAQQGRAPFPTLQPPYSTMRRRDYSYFLELVINTALQFIRCNNCYFKPISVLGGTSLGKHFLFMQTLYTVLPQFHSNFAHHALSCFQYLQNIMHDQISNLQKKTEKIGT